MSKPFSFGAIDVRLEAESDARPARAEDDTPFRVLLAADFSGRAARGLVETGAALGERKAFRVDLDSLDATIARLAPQVRLRDGDVIRLRELDDFLPDTLFARIARFATLKDASDADAKRRTTSRPAAGLLDRILDGAPQEEEPAVEAGPDGPTELMRTILGSSAFRELEAAWRGVDFLLRRLDVDGPLTLHVVDLSPEELRLDLLAGDDLAKTGLHRLLVEKTVGTPGAHPWAAFVVLGSFGPSPSDAEALGRLAKIAAQAGTAVLAGAEPGLVGCASLAETPDPDDWTEPTGPGAAAWAALRRLPEAKHVGLALPRILLRLPYGKETNAVDAFDFEELSSPPSHEEYLWGSPALALALLLGEAFLEDGWSLRPGSAQEISGLPFALVTQDGEKHAVPCAEALFTVRAAEAVTAKSLMPIVTMKGTDTVRLAIFQSIAEPYAALAGLWG
ncbi:MAG: type VI secretion system contractile sheath large subunit [Holophagales bacterium]|nr:type VI secretion system contractile sheath large subunit [Holophagales bacterium]